MVFDKFIEEGIITITSEEMEKVSILDDGESRIDPTAVEIRERCQYDTKLSLEDRTYSDILNLAKIILDKTKLMIEG